ncbi:MAG TPA: ribose-phosphate pyrophosphokinase [Candidatus Merdisoma faecalis]|uniref:ribose-phosphate pyrophosphokinase n=1 Tax=Lachnoclostridium sp. An138 TaxID=1965560 RepID=UPI000B38B089|nr:ribose-phosphate pyrophosphokinase [Lachnoclostridium sp. An138]OUQ19241.1 phosphoribosylpyrophosphate synthetase [Lachnoclostridium sp. An138]HIR97485.1 ribose-phosphate pyrophosphokinase [Candidatus Merdisoma faecalis]
MLLQRSQRVLETIPVGSLGLIPLKSCEELGRQVNDYLVKWRHSSDLEHKSSIAFTGYERDSYLIPAHTPRFGSGEGKGTIDDSVRGNDLYLMVDVCNYSLTYKLYNYTNRMSPDDHFQDLKRVIAAIGGKARRITVIMPYLYESRQHKRSARESLDCAMALQELVNMGVENILTFEAHDPRVQNAIPLNGFETVTPAYQLIKGLLETTPGLEIDSRHMLVISPDEGGMSRAVYLANVLGLDMGMFYKRRDYTRIINGRNPILAHEFLGTDIEGKDMIVVDDMISSGDSMLEVIRELKKRKARNIYIFCTFGLFTNGLEKFDKAYEEGLFTKLLTTNLVYQTPDLLSRPYYVSCNMSKYIALLVDTLNHDVSISDLLDPYDRIQALVRRYRNGELQGQD